MGANVGGIVGAVAGLGLAAYTGGASLALMPLGVWGTTAAAGATGAAIGGITGEVVDIPAARARKMLEESKASAAAQTFAKEKAGVEANAIAAAAKTAAEKKKADEEAKKKSTLLTKRRKGVSPFRTAGGFAGLLGQAPVALKTLLGQ